MKLFGIPISDSHLSDEEYIARLKTRVHKTRRLRYVYLTLGVAIIIFWTWGTIRFLEFLELDIAAPVEQKLIYMTYALAISFGLLIGFWIHQGFVNLMNAFFLYRRDTMLIDCWDRLHTPEKDALHERC